MIEALLITLLIAKIKGYKLKPLLKCPAIYPIFAFEIVYIILHITVFLGDYRFIQYASVIKSFYLYLFLIPVIRYKKYYSAIIGSIFTIIGGILNDIAIKANGGSMPVFPTLSYWTGYVKEDSFIKINDIHSVGNSEVKLKFLTDVIDIGYSILSIGDIFIRCFVFIIIFNVIKEANNEAFKN